MKQIKAVLLDKDGTLFDFDKTWSAWCGRELRAMARDQAHLAAMARALEFDLATERFAPTSVAIAGSPDDFIAALLPQMGGMSAGELSARLEESVQHAPLVAAVDLAPFCAGLRGAGMVLGLATNDSEAAARAHLDSAGIAGEFAMVLGCDSGFGAKPGPGMCRAFAEAQGLAPGEVVMVGDSLFDLQAGRAAGMVCVGVLTGPARAEDLAPWADAVLPDIGHLAGWLGH